MYFIWFFIILFSAHALPVPDRQSEFLSVQVDAESKPDSISLFGRVNEPPGPSKRKPPVASTDPQTRVSGSGSKSPPVIEKDPKERKREKAREYAATLSEEKKDIAERSAGMRSIFRSKDFEPWAPPPSDPPMADAPPQRVPSKRRRTNPKGKKKEVGLPSEPGQPSTPSPPQDTQNPKRQKQKQTSSIVQPYDTGASGSRPHEPGGAPGAPPSQGDPKGKGKAGELSTQTSKVAKKTVRASRVKYLTENQSSSQSIIRLDTGESLPPRKVQKSAGRRKQNRAQPSSDTPMPGAATQPVDTVQPSFPPPRGATPQPAIQPQRTSPSNSQFLLRPVTDWTRTGGRTGSPSDASSSNSNTGSSPDA